jgi:cytochrome c-type biogenesis protein CcmH/NrfG
MKIGAQTHGKEWTQQRALILAVACVAVGFAGGWFIRGGQTPNPSAPAKAVPAAQSIANPVPEPPTPAQMKAMADAQAAPLRERLKSDSNNPDLLTAIGNIYYDARQYPAAVDFYGRALNAKPADVSVRTDMATAYWYMGNADTAIVEFNKALTYAPNSPNTLFNRGLVKWKGENDVAGAEADWKKLLAANPNYEGKDNVEKTMAEARSQAAANSTSKTK